VIDIVAGPRLRLHRSRKRGIRPLSGSQLSAQIQTPLAKNAQVSALSPTRLPRGDLAGVYHSAGRLAGALPLYERTVAPCARRLRAGTRPR
jgi:hypothetical protein